MTAILYHNPKCSKSRQALTLLNEKGIEFEIIDYLKTPLSLAELKALLNSLDIPAHELLRTKEVEYNEAHLSKTSSETEILDAICKFPRLMERPIVSTDKGSRIGRPTEAIEDIL